MKSRDIINIIPFVCAILCAITSASAQTTRPSDQDNVDQKIVVNAGGIKKRFIYIKPGQFTMGIDTKLWDKLSDLGGEIMGPDEGPPHKVTITKGLYISKYEVTVLEYSKFLNSLNHKTPSQYIAINKFSRITVENGVYKPKPGASDCAINTVPWKGAKAFAEWWSNATKRNVRLPTEAEWEYTARGSEGRLYPWGDESLSKNKWLEDFSDEGCVAVDTFPKNTTPSNVKGMAGAVGEWVSDYYSDYPEEPQIDPKGPKEPTTPEEARVLRRAMPRATSRTPAAKVRPDAGIYGFRLVVEPK